MQDSRTCLLIMEAIVFKKRNSIIVILLNDRNTTLEIVKMLHRHKRTFKNKIENIGKIRLFLKLNNVTKKRI